MKHLHDAPWWCPAHLLPYSVCQCGEFGFGYRLMAGLHLPAQWCRQQPAAASIPTVSDYATGPVEWSWGKTSDLIMGFARPRCGGGLDNRKPTLLEVWAQASTPADDIRAFFEAATRKDASLLEPFP